MVDRAHYTVNVISYKYTFVRLYFVKADIDGNLKDKSTQSDEVMGSRLNTVRLA